MGGLNVKITILERLFGALAPDLCYSCGKIGHSFCSYCKYDITHEFVGECFWCGVPSAHGVCPIHKDAVDAVFALGLYSGGLKKAVEGLKFQRDKYLIRFFALELEKLLPVLTPDTVIVPVPTLARNTRRRGYDHVLLIAAMIAKMRGLKLDRLVKRQGAVVQHDTKERKEREVQVASMFTVHSTTPPDTVLLIDDIITTGSTVNQIASQLKAVGVHNVIVVCVARTP